MSHARLLVHCLRQSYKKTYGAKIVRALAAPLFFVTSTAATAVVAVVAADYGFAHKTGLIEQLLIIVCCVVCSVVETSENQYVPVRLVL